MIYSYDPYNRIASGYSQEKNSMNHKSMTKTIWLVAGYIALQLAADIAAVKMITFFRWAVPAGTLIFAITFTFRDLVHEHLGYRGAVNTVWAAAFANIVLALYLTLAIYMPAAPWWPGQDAFVATLGLIPRITVASILAEVISELMDTTVYQRMLDRKRAPWMRVAGSNAISVVMDSFTFTMMAFAFTMPFSALASIIVGQVIFKWAVTIVTLPVAHWFRKGAK